MKRGPKLILITIITFVGFLFLNKQIGIVNMPLFSVPNNSVRIKFINESDKTIRAIYINGKTIKSIEAGDNSIYTFKHSGEGTYQFIIEFETGDKLIENERYVEEGYYITETILNNSVKTNY